MKAAKPTEPRVRISTTIAPDVHAELERVMAETQLPLARALDIAVRRAMPPKCALCAHPAAKGDTLCDAHRALSKPQS